MRPWASRTCTVGPRSINKPISELASCSAPPPLLRKSSTIPSTPSLKALYFLGNITRGVGTPLRPLARRQNRHRTSAHSRHNGDTPNIFYRVSLHNFAWRSPTHWLVYVIGGYGFPTVHITNEVARPLYFRQPRTPIKVRNLNGLRSRFCKRILCGLSSSNLDVGSVARTLGARYRNRSRWRTTRRWQDCNPV